MLVGHAFNRQDGAFAIDQLQSRVDVGQADMLFQGSVGNVHAGADCFQLLGGESRAVIRDGCGNHAVFFVNVNFDQDAFAALGRMIDSIFQQRL